MKPINESRLKQVLTYIRDHQRMYGFSPSVRKIADGCRTSSTNVQRDVQLLRDRGMLRTDNGKIAVPERFAKGETKMIPLVGAIACGTPITAIENIEGSISLPRKWFGSGDYFILRAKGDSMIGAGIDDGDLVVLRMQNTARSGQIVAALVDDEATLKRFYPQPGLRRIRLAPENDAYDDIYVSDCTVQGVAVKVIKDL